MERAYLGWSNSMEKTALSLYEAGCFLVRSQSPGGKGFRLRRHRDNVNLPLSPYYLNLRSEDHPTKPGLLRNEHIKDIAMHFSSMVSVRNVLFDKVTGVPNAGIPFGMALAYMWRKPMVFLAKSESGSISVLGARGNGVRVLLVDDVISWGGSASIAIESLRVHGFQASDIFAVIDREEGGVARLRKAGVNVHTIFPISELVRFYVERGKLSENDATLIIQYLESPSQSS